LANKLQCCSRIFFGHSPQLVIGREHVHWRVPIVLTSRAGIVGVVGEVTIDAQTGELASSPDLAASLVANAKALLNRNGSPADPPSAAA
jgi:hypothetical protein